jgi:hypothetical protein
VNAGSWIVATAQAGTEASAGSAAVVGKVSLQRVVYPPKSLLQWMNREKLNGASRGLVSDYCQLKSSRLLPQQHPEASTKPKNATAEMHARNEAHKAHLKTNPAANHGGPHDYLHGQLQEQQHDPAP